jgi:hypothetical protein
MVNFLSASSSLEDLQLSRYDKYFFIPVSFVYCKLFQERVLSFAMPTNK